MRSAYPLQSGVPGAGALPCPLNVPRVSSFFASCKPQSLKMKSLARNEVFAGALKYAIHARFLEAHKKPISFAALILILFTFLSFSGCTGIAVGSKTSLNGQTTGGAATISVAPASIDFGSVPVGGTGSQSVTISNSGGSTLTVTQASTTAAGITISGISLPLLIGPGSQSNFNLVFSPKKAGALSGQVSVMSDLSTSPNMVTLSGIGMAASASLTASASSLSFGNVAIGKSKALSVLLTNAGNSNVTVTKITISGAHFSASGISGGLILAPGQSATLDATFNPAAIGALSGVVTVASSAKNSPATISLSGDGALSGSPSVVLAWTPSVSSVAGYHVYRSEVSGGPYKILNSGIVTTDSYTDSAVSPGITYYYVVKSVSHAGVESADSAQTSATVPVS